MSRQRELVGRPRPGRPVRDRSVLDAPTWEPLTDLDGPDGAPPVPRETTDTLSASGRVRLRPVGAPDDDVLAAVPAPRATVVRTGATASGTRRGVPGRHRLPRPPRRRGPVLLAALVLGGLLAALPGGLASRTDERPVAAEAGDYGLSATESNFAGGLDDADARNGISQAEAAARLDAVAASRAEREPDFVLPTDGRMSTCYCQRWGQMHWGIDLAAPLGTPIVAAADGVVLRAGPASGYGNAIYIQDVDGNVEIYGHMRYMYVSAGDVVSAGDLIAKVGSEGQSTGPHLHFEIHQGSMTGSPTSPEDWLADRGVSIPGG